MHLSRPGLVAKLAQCAGAWHVRGSPGVKQAFAAIWGTPELIVSMDCVIVWRPWWLDESWRPKTEGLHLDQNPFHKPNLECVQGMVPLLPVTEAIGGLQVVPESHTDKAKQELMKLCPHLKNRGDWCMLGGINLTTEPQLLLADPGDLILWDSRTIHGGVVGTGVVPDGHAQGTGEPCGEFARLAVTVAMTPRARASALVQAMRVDGFQAGRCFNHSPHEAGRSSGTLTSKPPTGYSPILLNAAQAELL